MIPDFPELTTAHIAGARLYATRKDLIVDLPIPRVGEIAELGVALGSFSKFIIEELRPRRFHAFDLFQLHNEVHLWGQKTSDVLHGMKHVEFYRQEVTTTGAEVVIHEGPSQQTLPRVPDQSFDMIYIDAEHTYEEVKADAEIATRKIKRDGILIFNDYIMHDPFVKADYGIVPVVNEMVVNQGWRVVGFALQKHLFCDIAVRRA
jgi:Methyltransferase domain